MLEFKNKDFSHKMNLNKSGSCLSFSERVSLSSLRFSCSNWLSDFSEGKETSSLSCWIWLKISERSSFERFDARTSKLLFADKFLFSIIWFYSMKRKRKCKDFISIRISKKTLPRMQGSNDNDFLFIFQELLLWWQDLCQFPCSQYSKAEQGARHFFLL